VGIHGETNVEGRGLRFTYVNIYACACACISVYVCVYVSAYVYGLVYVRQFSSCAYCSQRFTYRARPTALRTSQKMKHPPGQNVCLLIAFVYENSEIVMQ
jgi:hypothetical protein